MPLHHKLTARGKRIVTVLRWCDQYFSRLAEAENAPYSPPAELARQVRELLAELEEAA